MTTFSFTSGAPRTPPKYLFFCGIVLAHYNSYNLSEASRRTAELSAKMLAQVKSSLK